MVEVVCVDMAVDSIGWLRRRSRSRHAFWAGASRLAHSY
jgi:hypothetical protein